MIEEQFGRHVLHEMLQKGISFCKLLKSILTITNTVLIPNVMSEVQYIWTEHLGFYIKDFTGLFRYDIFNDHYIPLLCC